MPLTVTEGGIRAPGEFYRGAGSGKVLAESMTGDDTGGRSDLEALGEKIARARGEEAEAEKVARVSGASVHDGMRIAIEFVVSVLVGAGLGYTIGSFFEAPVIGLVVGMPLGFAAGLRTVYRGMMAGAAADEERNGPDGDV